MAVPTPHISSRPGEIAKTVLMPGDPLRAKFIAETFLENPVLVNNVRGVQGHTGTWKGAPVTVMASGMGMPAIGIYSWELFGEYGVENIIRIGSCGAIQDELKLMDIVIGQAACCQGGYIEHFKMGGVYAPIADYKLLTAAVDAAKELGIDVTVGNILSSDNFYSPAGCNENDKWRKMGILGIEMEAAALYANAAYHGKRALCICSVSDHIYREEYLSSEERQVGFTQMMEIALDTAVKMAKL